MEIEILFENGAYLVCVKPAGLLSEEGQGSLPYYLKEQTGADVYPVHRLDRGTGGVMVYAKTKESAAALSELVRAGNLRKEYLAVVRGTPQERAGVLQDLLFHDKRANKSYTVKKQRAGVKSASLEYNTVDSKELNGVSLTLLHIRLHTGRTHQIRVQFASRKMPLYGDGKYGGRTENGGLALWSYSLSFEFPGGEHRCFCQLPPCNTPWTLFDADVNK